jgi:hypothetical protein
MHRRPWYLARHHEAHWKEKLVPRFQSVCLGSRWRCAHGAAGSAGRIVRAAVMLLAAAASAHAQTTQTLDATSGTATFTTDYTTTGGLTLNMGFFADYLVVGGGGGDVETGTGLQLSSTNYPVNVGAGNVIGGAAGATAGSSSALGITGTGGRNSTTSDASRQDLHARADPRCLAIRKSGCTGFGSCSSRASRPCTRGSLNILPD